MSTREELSDELLTAYHDGEVTAEDRDRVARAMESQAADSHTLEDLKVLTAGLQKLPRFSLDDAFADRVLATIREREATVVTGWQRVRWRTVAALAASAAAVVLIAVALMRGGNADPRRSTEVAQEQGSAPGSGTGATSSDDTGSGGRISPLIENPGSQKQFMSADGTPGRAAKGSEKVWHVLIYEMALTPEGVRQNVLGKALKQANVDLIKDDVRLDPKLARSLLSTRFLNGTRPLDPNDLVNAKDKEAAHEVRLLYVAARARQIDETYEFLRAQNREVAALRLTIGIEPTGEANTPHQQLFASLHGMSKQRFGSGFRLRFESALVSSSLNHLAGAYLPIDRPPLEGPQSVRETPGLFPGEQGDAPAELLCIVHHLKRDLRLSRNGQ